MSSDKSDMVEVIAISTGYYPNIIRKEGDRFMVPADMGTASWFQYLNPQDAKRAVVIAAQRAEKAAKAALRAKVEAKLLAEAEDKALQAEEQKLEKEMRETLLAKTDSEKSSSKNDKPLA